MIPMIDYYIEILKIIKDNPNLTEEELALEIANMVRSASEQEFRYFYEGGTDE